jgi:hypothetical protein
MKTEDIYKLDNNLIYIYEDVTFKERIPYFFFNSKSYFNTKLSVDINLNDQRVYDYIRFLIYCSGQLPFQLYKIVRTNIVDFSDNVIYNFGNGKLVEELNGKKCNTYFIPDIENKKFYIRQQNKIHKDYHIKSMGLDFLFIGSKLLSNKDGVMEISFKDALCMLK